MPQQKEQTAAELASLGYSAKELLLETLARDLAADEALVGAVAGAATNGMDTHDAILALTSRRIIHIVTDRSGWFSSASIRDDHSVNLSEVTGGGYNRASGFSRTPWHVHLETRGGGLIPIVAGRAVYSGPVRFWCRPEFTASPRGTGIREYFESSIKEQIFADFIQLVLQKVDALTSNAASPERWAGNSFISELERLAALRQSGALTKEEFQAAKQKLLA